MKKLMHRSIVSLAACLVILSFSLTANAQIPVTVTDRTHTSPYLDSTYTSLASALTALNTVSAMSGPVTLTLGAGSSEIAPRAGFTIGSASLNAVLSSTRTVTIVKESGTVTLVAGVGTATPSSASPDGILKLTGADWITIDGITFTDNNVSNPATMEFGIGLFKLIGAGADGCNNNTIKNCTINMQSINNASSTGIGAEGSVGILMINSVASSATNGINVTTAAGSNSNNKFYSNTINGGNYGMALIGYVASTFTLADLNNDIGGSSFETGNTILNFGGAPSATNPSAGIRTLAQYSINVSYNTINNNNGSGVNHTNVLRGIYFNTAVSANATISNNILTILSGGTTTLCTAIDNISGSTAAGNTININNNTVYAGYTTATSGIYAGINCICTASTVNINGNKVKGIADLAGTGSHIMIECGSGIVTNTNNDTVTGITRSGASGTWRGIKSSSPPTWNVNGCIVDSLSWTNPASTGSTDAIYFNSGNNALITNCTVRNLYVPGTSTMIGISGNSSGGTHLIQNNHIYNFATSAGGAGGFIARGIVNSTGGNYEISSNNIHSLNSTGTTGGTAGSLVGIYCGTTASSMVYKNKVYDLSTNSTGGSSGNLSASVIGIGCEQGSLTTIYNNTVADLRTPNANLALAIAGIAISAGTSGTAACRVYNNSVYINASSTGTTFGTAAFYTLSTSYFTLQNNLFVNTSIAGVTSGLTAAFRKNTFSGLPYYDTISNNNCYYAGTPGSKNLIYSDGGNSDQTLAAFKNRMVTRDGSSVTENPHFKSISGADADFLRIDSTFATQLESGGITVSVPDIKTDYFNVMRYPNSGYPDNNGSASAPDIGASEFGGIRLDITAPVITYTGFLNTASLSDRTLTAVIKDVSTGVPVSGSLRPRIYYKKGSGSYFSQPGTLTSGTATNGIWDFNIVAADMGGLTASSVISYYVIAQDQASPINIASSPAGAVATNVNTITTPPTPNTYTIVAGISGVKTVGVGKDYTTLRAAVTDLNAKGLTGPLTLSLTDALYSASETFPITINANGGSSAVNTVTIKPAEGNTNCAITGSTTSAPLIINGADYIIIDGSNNGSASRDLTITNTNTGTFSAVVWAQTTGTNGSTNNTIKNCNITGSGNLQTVVGIGFGSSSINVTGGGTGANNNTISNNNVSKVTYGIYSAGGALESKNSNNTISDNLLNTTGVNAIGRAGIFVAFENNITISGNIIDGITSAGTGDVFGIAIGYNIITTSDFGSGGRQVSNAVISNNKIGMVTQTNSQSACGIFLASYTTGSATISNNSIYGVGCNGTLSKFASAIAVCAAATTLTNIYYNSISMSGTFSGGTSPSYGIVIGQFSAPPVNIINNDVSNTQVNGTGNSYAVCYAYTNFTTLSCNYNNFYTTVGPTFFIGRTVSVSAGTNAATLANWKTLVSKDANSVSADPGFTSSSDLKIDSTNSNAWNVKGMGMPLASYSTDILGKARSTSNAGGPTDIGAYNVTPTSLPPTAVESAAPVINTTTTYTLNGKTLASILWKNSGTPPTSMALNFYPGITPPGANPSNAPVGSGYWIFTPTGGAGYSYDITINYEDAQLGNIGSESDIILAKSDNGGAGYVPFNIPDGGSHSAGTYLLNTTANTIKIWGLTEFSIFALTDGNGPLPVELNSFTSTVEKRNVELKWSTASEVNSAGFDIERKIKSEEGNSSSWVKAGSVTGAGNSSNVHNYNFKDRNLTTGNYNYRLKQIDNNGNFKYYELSNEVVVNVPVKFDLSQNYPNPFNPTTKINYDLPFDSKVNISIYDMTGRLINEIVNAQQTAGAYTLTFNASGIASGTYFYRINATGAGQSFVKTLKMMFVK